MTMIMIDEYGFGPENVGLMIMKTNNNGLYWEYHWDNNVGLIFPMIASHFS